jgi:hypothetical protein
MSQRPGRPVLLFSADGTPFRGRLTIGEVVFVRLVPKGPLVACTVTATRPLAFHTNSRATQPATVQSKE